MAKTVTGVISEKDIVQQARGRMVTLHVERHFAAAHRLPMHEGKCQHMHGHTWRVQVWIKAKVGTSGMAVDFGHIKSLIDAFDHGCVNDILANPTAENLAWYLNDAFFDLGGERIKQVVVRVWESETAYAEAHNYSNWRDQEAKGRG